MLFVMDALPLAILLALPALLGNTKSKAQTLVYQLVQIMLLIIT